MTRDKKNFLKNGLQKKSSTFCFPHCPQFVKFSKKKEKSEKYDDIR